MNQSESRIFVYRPSAPESPPEHEPDPDQVSTVDLGELLRDWAFSLIGAICVWLLTASAAALAAGIVLLLLPENFGILAVGCGLWLLLGLTVVHWWIPAGAERRRHSEGLAIAGWHSLISLVATGGMALVILQPGGSRPTFTLSEIPPIMVVGGIILAMFGTILTLLRGYRPGQGLRYAWTLLCVIAVWMTLWLVAVHAGM